MRRLHLLPALAIAAIVAGCGGAPPPDTATSEQQVRQTAIAYNVLAASGKGEQACALLTDERLEWWKTKSPVVRDAPAGIHDCASFWDWFGPRMSATGRGVMLGTQVSAVRIDGDRATATYATGGTVPLRWSGAVWQLD